MIARPEDIESIPAPAMASAPMFARTVLDMAAQVEQAETAIKAAIVAAARDDNCARVIDIVTRWQHMPATEVLAAGTSCGKSPVLPPHALIDGARSR